MTWEYAGPAASDKDALRFALGDTDAALPLFSDEELAYLLSLTGQGHTAVLWAAYGASMQLVARYARYVDTTEGDFRQQASQLYEHWKDMATQFRARVEDLDNVFVLPQAGGLTSRSRIPNRLFDYLDAPPLDVDIDDYGYLTPPLKWWNP